MNEVLSIKQRMVAAEQENQYLRSLLDSFFTGDVPQGASTDHMILAKYGRKRHDDLQSQPALFR